MKLKWHETQVAGIEDCWCVCWFDLPSLRVCLLPRNLFPVTSQVFQVADALSRSAGKFSEKSSQQLLGNPHSPTLLGSACHRHMGPQPGPSRTYQDPCCPSRVAQNCK